MILEYRLVCVLFEALSFSALRFSCQRAHSTIINIINLIKRRALKIPLVYILLMLWAHELSAWRQSRALGKRNEFLNPIFNPLELTDYLHSSSMNISRYLEKTSALGATLGKKAHSISKLTKVLWCCACCANNTLVASIIICCIQSS